MTNKTKTKTISKVDEKQKKHMLQVILNAHPEIHNDNLQIHYVEQLIESYLIDPNEFNRKTAELVKKEKKNPPAEGSKLPDEIVCISKIEAEEEKEGLTNVVVADTPPPEKSGDS
jgi:hypothetical protein